MQNCQYHLHDLVVIGSGLAGLRAAQEAARQGLRVAVVSKTQPFGANSVSARDGVNAALGNAGDDAWQQHAQETIAAAAGLGDRDAVELLCAQAPQTVIELEHSGCIFARQAEGRIAQRQLGQNAIPRAGYSLGILGHDLLHVLYEQCRALPAIEFLDEFLVTRLVEDKGCCAGCVALDKSDGTLHGFAARATLLATGGYGRLFSRTTNCQAATGDGAALTLGIGMPVKDMEFVQFLPMVLSGTNVPISETARQAGGHLLNSRRERFMRSYDPSALEAAPADIVIRAAQREINAGRGVSGEYVHLDLRHLGAERIREQLTDVRQLAIDFLGIDPIDAPLPVQPAQHYSLGGVATSTDGATPLTGLYAAGEAACVNAQGANCLAGNALLDPLIFGKRASQTIVRMLPHLPVPSQAAVEQALRQELAHISDILERRNGERVSNIRDDLRMMMFEMFGIFREESQMKEGLGILASLKERLTRVAVTNRSSHYNLALTSVLELKLMLPVAEAVALSALARQESRGVHLRLDFPERDDRRWALHTMVWPGDKGLEVLYQPVRTKAL